jgi:predicted amidohydrolase
MYVVMAGLTGTCGDLELSGGSAVYDPEGRALERLGDESPGIVVADLDPEEVTRVRERHPMLHDLEPGEPVPTGGVPRIIAAAPPRR